MVNENDMPVCVFMYKWLKRAGRPWAGWAGQAFSGRGGGRQMAGAAFLKPGFWHAGRCHGGEPPVWAKRP